MFSNDYYDPRVGESLYAGTGVNPISEAQAALAGERAKTNPDPTKIHQLQDTLNKVIATQLVFEVDERIESGKVQILVDDSILNGKILSPSQQLALLSSVTLIGPSSEISNIAQSSGLTIPVSSVVANNNNGNGKALGGVNIAGLSTLSTAFPGGINLINNDYVDKNGTLSNPATVLAHELSHSGEVAVYNIINSISSSTNLTSQEKQTLQYASDAVVASQIDSAEHAELSKDLGVGGQSTLSYMSRNTEIIAFVENNGLDETASMLSLGTGLSNDEALEYVKDVYESDAITSINYWVNEGASLIIEMGLGGSK